MRLQQRENLSETKIIDLRRFVQKFVDGAGEGIRTPVGAKPTSCLAFFRLLALYMISRLAR
jgi:hypothetical protein